MVGLVLALAMSLGWTASPAVGGPRVVAYYGSWSGASSYYPYTKLDFSQVTHIAQAFVYPNTNGTLDTTSDFSYYPQLVQAAHAHGVKVIISFGGSGSANFGTMTGNSVSRSNFVANVTTFCLTNNYDGADIDWEAPGNSTQKLNFTLLIQQLRASFNAVNPSWTLSAAVKPTASSGQWLDVPALNTNLDWFAVMSYDFKGSWSPKSGHNAPLYAAPGDPQGPTYCADAAIQYYTSHGASASKVMIGLPFYGQQFNSTNLYATSTGGGEIMYTNAVADLSNGWTRVWDDAPKVPYLLNPGRTNVVSYDDTLSIQYKCDYAVGNRLGGAFIWEITEDTAKGQLQQPLIDVVSASILGTTNTLVMLDTFEGTYGNFYSSPTASSSTVGIATSSTASLTTATTHGGANSLKLVLNDDSSSSSNWAVRFLSNGGNPVGQVNVGTNGYLGFWLRTSASKLSVGIAVTDTDGIERSVSQAVVGDSQWYHYEWNLGDPSQWTAWSNGNGVVSGPVVTVDSIWFYAPNGSSSTTIYLDDVYKANKADRVNAPIAVAGLNQVIAVGALATNVTLNGSASSSPRVLPMLKYQWTQIAGPTVTLINPTASVTRFTYTGVVYANTDLQFQLTVDDGLFTSNDTTTVTLVPTDSVGDGIPDWWRQQYFSGGGTNTNSVSCAACDADGTGQNNLFKYVAGLDPTNPASQFALQIATVGNQAMNLMFSPISTGRTYTVQLNADLASDTYSDLTGFVGPSTNSVNNQVTITDPNAILSNEFYRVHISLP